jgi:hypothetical protein
MRLVDHTVDGDSLALTGGLPPGRLLGPVALVRCRMRTVPFGRRWLTGSPARACRAIRFWIATDVTQLQTSVENPIVVVANWGIKKQVPEVPQVPGVADRLGCAGFGSKVWRMQSSFA